MHSLWYSFILVISCQESKTTTDTVDEDTVIADSDGDGFPADEDCNDEDGEINPSATEICDGIDNNCDGEIDEAVRKTFFADSDGDGFGNDDISAEGCSVPDGFVENGNDCNDASAAAYPGAEEICDDLDNNCDGEVDEELLQTFYLDADGDGFGTASESVEACNVRLGLSLFSDDCNDEDASIHPLASEICDDLDNNCDEEVDEGLLSAYYEDVDNDSFGADDTVVYACSAPEGYVERGGDCDDIETLAHPYAIEVCDDIDNDCDGNIDETGAYGTFTAYIDDDGDGFGLETNAIEVCSMPSGYALVAGDCDDAAATAHPAATEICDGIDNDCDGDADSDAVDRVTWYADDDGDLRGDAQETMQSCNASTGYVSNSDDCDDTNNIVYSGADEICDGIDNDCDGDTDEISAVDATTWYLDFDGDGFGLLAYAQVQCDAPTGYVSNSDDCDDANSAVNTSADEICDGIDNNCDGDIDSDAIDKVSWYIDDDSDGYGDETNVTLSCSAPDASYVAQGLDCDDQNANVYDGAPQGCDEIDYNCDGLIDNDADGDGYSDQSCGGQDCDDADATINPDGGICASGSSCLDILDNGLSTGNGTYYIDIGIGDPLEVYCDMTTDGGGWTQCGNIDEVIASDNYYTVVEGDYLDYGSLVNESFCVAWYNEQSPTEMLFHNTTSGGAYGENEKIIVEWGNSPFSVGNYNNHPLQSCRALVSGASWSTCYYATHSGWDAASFSFTVNGLTSGYSSNQDRRLILGPTVLDGSHQLTWHNFGANTNSTNNANTWYAVTNVGYFYMR